MLPPSDTLSVTAVPQGDGWTVVNGHYRVETQAVSRMRDHHLDDDLILISCLEEHYRRAILAESDPSRRTDLYRQAYSELSAIHEVRNQMDHGVSPHVLRLVAPYITNKTVLELGCGTGTFARTACGLAASYTGMDASTVAIKLARKQVTAPNAQFLVASTTDPPDGIGPFDVIYSNDFLEHLHPADCARTLSHCAKWLRPGGLLFSLIPNRLFGPFDISRRYLPEGTAARCLHLNELSHTDAAALFSAAGFTDLRSPLSPLRSYVSLPQPIRRLLLAPLSIKAAAERTPLRRGLLVRPFGLRSVILFARTGPQ